MLNIGGPGKIDKMVDSELRRRNRANFVSDWRTKFARENFLIDVIAPLFVSMLPLIIFYTVISL